MMQHAQKEGLTPEQKALFFEQGYLVVPDLFTTEEVKSTKNALSDIVATAYELGQRDDFPEDGYLEHEGARFVLKRKRVDEDRSWDVNVLRVVGCGSVDPTLLATTRAPKLLEIVGGLLDSRELDQIICQFHPKEPGDGVSFKLHRDVANRGHFDPDWTDVSGNGSYLIACIAIDSVEEDNGGLMVLPGSNIGYDYKADPDPDNPQLSPGQEDNLVLPLLHAGSVLLMHPYMLHKSSANRSHQSRYTLLGGYAVPGANSKPYPGGWSVHQRIGVDGKVLVEDLYSSSGTDL